MRSRVVLNHIAQGCAALVVGIASLALAGWALDSLLLARFHAAYIPMAPSTALAFLLLGGSVFGYAREGFPRWGRAFCLAAAILVSLVGVMILVQSVVGVDLGVERWLAPTSATLGGVPLGRMSPMTAANFLVASLALLVLLTSTARWRPAYDVAASLAAGVVALGLLVILGYVYDTPLLYGGPLIPMALPTAGAFVLLGVALVFLAGPPARTLRGYLPAALALGVGVLASVVVFALVERLEQTRVRSEFERRATVLATALQRSIDTELQAVESVEELFASDEEVTRLEFREFAARLLARHPSLQALSWNPRVSNEERPAYEAAARRDGYPDFRFTELDGQNEVAAAGRRAQYVIAYYIEPAAGNERALGFDAASRPTQLAALERARDSAQMAASSRITLGQGTGPPSGVMIFRSIYRPGTPYKSVEERRANLLGFAVGIYRIEALVQTGLQGVDRDGIDFVLSEAPTGAGESLLFASADARPARQSGPSWIASVGVADRRWTLEAYPTPGFLAAHRTGEAWGVLGSGLLLTVLVGGYFFSSTRHTAEIVKAQRDLVRRTQQLEAVRAISEEITRELDIGTLLDLIHRHAAELVGGTAGTVYLWDEAAQVLVPRAWHGLGEWMREGRRRLGEGVAGTVAQRREGMIVNDYRTSAHALPLILERTGITAVLAEPLLYRDRLLGVIVIDTDQSGRTFTRQDGDLLALFAAQASIAMENARLHTTTRLHAAELEDRVRERTAELEEALRAKAEFLAKMSHELRTPLNFVLGFAQLLKEGVGGGLTPRQEHFVDRISMGGRQLLALISDILELSLVEAGKRDLQLEPVLLAPLVQEIQDAVRVQAAQKRLELSVILDPAVNSVVADRRRLVQILVHLLDNAVKFTPDGGRITVAARRVDRSRSQVVDSPQPVDHLTTRQIDSVGDWLEFVVEDTGIGIRAEDLERIFQGFEQVDSSDRRKYGGAGIGLSLVRVLVQLHGGRVWAESPGPGQGARVVVRLPRLETPRPTRILVVEDEAPLQEALCAALWSAGFAPEQAHNGTQALAALDSGPPDLLVLDIGLPDVDGWEVLKRVRGEERTRDLPVLILTGLEHIHADQAMALGADEFLAKPVSARVLVETAARLLKQSAAVNAARR